MGGERRLDRGRQHQLGDNFTWSFVGSLEDVGSVGRLVLHLGTFFGWGFQDGFGLDSRLGSRWLRLQIEDHSLAWGKELLFLRHKFLTWSFVDVLDRSLVESWYVGDIRVKMMIRTKMKSSTKVSGL